MRGERWNEGRNEGAKSEKTKKINKRDGNKRIKNEEGEEKKKTEN